MSLANSNATNAKQAECVVLASPIQLWRSDDWTFKLLPYCIVSIARCMQHVFTAPHTYQKCHPGVCLYKSYAIAKWKKRIQCEPKRNYGSICNIRTNGWADGRAIYSALDSLLHIANRPQRVDFWPYLSVHFNYFYFILENVIRSDWLFC